MANGAAVEFSVAAQIKDQPEPLSDWYRFEEEKPFGHFAHLLHGIERMYQTGRTSWPLERTLLTSGVLDHALRSKAQQGVLLPTPSMEIVYNSVDWPFPKGDPGTSPV